VALWFTALEALQNAAKHADGAPARLTLRRSGDHVELIVTDAGPGFDPAVTSAGAGLANMRDRLAAVEGHLHIDTAPGAGTTVTARIAAEDV
jgi:signal transduction histidine kinase